MIAYINGNKAFYMFLSMENKLFCKKSEKSYPIFCLLEIIQMILCGNSWSHNALSKKKQTKTKIQKTALIPVTTQNAAFINDFTYWQVCDLTVQLLNCRSCHWKLLTVDLWTELSTLMQKLQGRLPQLSENLCLPCAIYTSAGTKESKCHWQICTTFQMWQKISKWKSRIPLF